MSKPIQKPAILIVDDTPENLDVLKAALWDDYSVRPAINGAIALKLAEMTPQPDLIILDVVMPGMDGYEICRQLKSNPQTSDIPVIFVTAKAELEDELEGLAMGAVDYMSKPISPPLIKARVITHLALRKANREMEEKNSRLYEINERLTNSLEQLSASEERFRSLVQTIPDIVYKIDAEGCFTFLNKSIERLGYHQSDLIGQHFTTIIHSADAQSASLANVIARIGKGTPNPGQKLFDERRTGLHMTIGLEIRLKTKSGTPAEIAEIKSISDQPVSVEVNSTGLYGDVGTDTYYKSRQYIGTVGVIRDITDRQKAQKKLDEEKELLRQLIDAVPMPIFFMDGSANLIFSNQAFHQVVAIKNTDSTGMAFVELFGEHDSHILTTLIESFLDDDRTMRITKTCEISFGNQESKTINVILTKFLNNVPAKPSIIGIFVDITDQKIFEETLIQAKADAETMAQKADAANLAKGNFLANMSHEIRTPMNAIIGFTHLCLQSELTKKQATYLNKISNSSNALLRLLNDILDFSKIDAGRLSMEMTEFAIADVLNDVASTFSLKSKAKGVEFVLHVAPSIAATLIGDPFRLGQILANLVGNAVKFTDHGEIIVKVAPLEETPEKTIIQFCIKDTGIGMSQNHQDQLFQEFAQADASTTRKYGGTGLGLVICKRLVEMMQGSIWVESSPQTGSHFHFTAQFTRPKTDAKTLTPPAYLQNMKVLVVDDNESARFVITSYLEPCRCDVTIAMSGSSALAIIADAASNERPFALIILDWKMDEMNGLEAAYHIRNELALKQQPRILMLSAFNQEDIIKKETQRDLVDGFLEKPITTYDLLTMITTVCAADAMPASKPLDDSDDSNIVNALKNTHVLLVEDNEANLVLGEELLTEVNVRVSVAKNGEEAVAMITNTQFDAVLIDLHMPIMDGITATREIRKNPALADLPIIAVTANVMRNDKENCLKAGMNDYIPKPVNPTQLYTTLVRWIRPEILATLKSAHTNNHHNVEVGIHDQVAPKISIAEPITDDLEALTPLFQSAASLLRSFDTSIEDVVTQMDVLIKTPERRSQLNQLTLYVETYDFEDGLKFLLDWAEEDGIELGAHQ